MQDMAYIGGQDKVDNKCKTLVGDPAADNPVDRMQLLQETLATSDRSVFENLQRTFAPAFKKAVLQMTNTAPINLAMLPKSIKDRYSNKTHDQFLITIFPSDNIWTDANFLKQFVSDLDNVSDRVTGMPPVFLSLIRVIGADGRRALLLTIVVVFLLLWLDFGKIGYALLAMAPLAFGLVWMVGFMKLTTMQFTVMNVMGLPMILGIGIDDGVHVVHRWISEGKSNLFIVFASTGKAILLTSLTTMLAFGSLVFSIWRGFGQLGGALFLGVAACFLATITVLPFILGLLEQRKQSGIRQL